MWCDTREIKPGVIDGETGSCSYEAGILFWPGAAGRGDCGVSRVRSLLQRNCGAMKEMDRSTSPDRLGQLIRRIGESMADRGLVRIDWCSRLTDRVARVLGCDAVPIYGMCSRLESSVDDGKDFSERVQEAKHQEGVCYVSPVKAQRMANRGRFVVMLSPGEDVVMTPVLPGYECDGEAGAMVAMPGPAGVRSCRARDGANFPAGMLYFQLKGNL